MCSKIGRGLLTGPKNCHCATLQSWVSLVSDGASGSSNFQLDIEIFTFLRHLILSVEWECFLSRNRTLRATVNDTLLDWLLWQPLSLNMSKLYYSQFKRALLRFDTSGFMIPRLVPKISPCDDFCEGQKDMENLDLHVSPPDRLEVMAGLTALIWDGSRWPDLAEGLPCKPELKGLQFEQIYFTI